MCPFSYVFFIFCFFGGREGRYAEVTVLARKGAFATSPSVSRRGNVLGTTAKRPLRVPIRLGHKNRRPEKSYNQTHRIGRLRPPMLFLRKKKELHASFSPRFSQPSSLRFVGAFQCHRCLLFFFSLFIYPLCQFVTDACAISPHFTTVCLLSLFRYQLCVHVCFALRTSASFFSVCLFFENVRRKKEKNPRLQLFT